MAQVIIVGAGVTGSCLASLVREMGLVVRVLEKSRGPGGRMATHTFRGDPPGSRDAAVLGRADLGAQYITTRTTEDHPQLGPIYRQLTDAGVLSPFLGEVAGPNPYGNASGHVRHFTAPQGLGSVSQHFLQAGATAGQTLTFGAALDEVSLNPDGTVCLRLGGDAGEIPLAEKCVIVFTQPVPQVLGASKYSLKGNFLESADPSMLAGLRQVQYSSRFAMAFSFPSAEFKWPYNWDVSYFEGGHVRYVSHDTAKRRAVDEPAASIVVHSGVPLGIELIDEEDPFATAGARLVEELLVKLPEVPWKSAASTKVHKWRYSQVYKAFNGARPAPDWTWNPSASDAADTPGTLQLSCSERALVLLAGDAVAPSSNFEGCVYSAHRTASAVREFLSTGRAEL